MSRTDQPAVVAALARAFFADPLFDFFVPNRVRQARMLLRFMKSGVVDARPFRDVWVARRNGDVASAAVWLPPGAYPRGARRDLRQLADLVPNMPAMALRTIAGLRLLSAMDKEHHKGPHWYLAILGTDPSYQRSGAGSAALQPVLDRCDTEGLPAYLETQKEENLAYYARHKFELVQRMDVKGCPPLWTMLRTPR